MPRITLCILVAVTCLSYPVGASETVDVHFIDVGAGDAILIDCGDFEALLDAGPGSAEANAAVRAVLAEHVTDGVIELAILSHPHADHYGGFFAVFATYRVLEFWRSTDTTPDTSGTGYASFGSALAAEGLTTTFLTRGERRASGQLVWDVLGPGPLRTTPVDANDNNNSLVLLLSFGNTHYLFMGDVESGGETALFSSALPIGPLVLKVAHHGSATSTSSALLDWATPDAAIISTGYADPPALRALRDCQIPVPTLLTSNMGTITIATDGNSCTASASSGALAVIGAATPTPAPGDELFLSLSPVAPTGQGGTATASARTLPGASCTIAVYYTSGPSAAAGLLPKTADSVGSVSWSWRVGTRTSPGQARIVISSEIAGQLKTQVVYFQIVDTGALGRGRIAAGSRSRRR
jgi:beta-lactamase superfamily II metal-dependent hydrolase